MSQIINKVFQIISHNSNYKIINFIKRIENVNIYNEDTNLIIQNVKINTIYCSNTIYNTNESINKTFVKNYFNVCNFKQISITTTNYFLTGIKKLQIVNVSGISRLQTYILNLKSKINNNNDYYHGYELDTNISNIDFTRNVR